MVVQRPYRCPNACTQLSPPVLAERAAPNGLQSKRAHALLLPRASTVTRRGTTLGNDGVFNLEVDALVRAWIRASGSCAPTPSTSSSGRDLDEVRYTIGTSRLHLAAWTPCRSAYSMAAEKAS